MAKSKNHTSHTLNYKNHKNGIQKPLKVRLNALKGMDCKYIRNMRFAKKHNKKAVAKKE